MSEYTNIVRPFLEKKHDKILRFNLLKSVFICGIRINNYGITH